MTNSPLMKYYRTPGIHVTLPSRYEFNDSSDFELSMNKELAVYPMTAKDEIWIKNPDALLNGTAIEEVVRSCVPGVKNPRFLTSNDIDFLLLAIKKVTYGDTLELPAKCPKCNETHVYECSIDSLINNTVPYPENKTIRFNDELIGYIRPHPYFSATLMNIAAFEETKMLEVFTNSDMTKEDRVKVFSNSYERISSLNLELIANTVFKIVGPDFETSNNDEIREFIKNSPKAYVDLIKNKVDEYNDKGLQKQIELPCQTDKCDNVWVSDIIFDPSSFFA